jgi:hypothetical protein
MQHHVQFSHTDGGNAAQQLPDLGVDGLKVRILGNVVLGTRSGRGRDEKYQFAWEERRSGVIITFISLITNDCDAHTQCATWLLSHLLISQSIHELLRCGLQRQPCLQADANDKRAPRINISVAQLRLQPPVCSSDKICLTESIMSIYLAFIGLHTPLCASTEIQFHTPKKSQRKAK